MQPSLKEVTTGTYWWLGTLLKPPWPRTTAPDSLLILVPTAAVVCFIMFESQGSKLKGSTCWRKHPWNRWKMTFLVKWSTESATGAQWGYIFDESPSPDNLIIRTVKSSWSLSLCDTMTLFSLLLLLIIFIVVIERCSRSTLSAKFVLLYRADAISPDLNPICLLTAKHGWKEG